MERVSEPIPNVPLSTAKNDDKHYQIQDQTPVGLSKVYFKYSYTNLEQLLKPLIEGKSTMRPRPVSIGKISSDFAPENPEAYNTVISNSKEEIKDHEPKMAVAKGKNKVEPSVNFEKVRSEFQLLLKKKYQTRSKYTFHDKIPLFNKKAYLLKLGCKF